MLTLAQLFNGTRQLRNKVNATNSFELTQYLGLPFARVLAVQFQFQPYTEEEAVYHEVTMLFHNELFNETETETYNFPVKVVGNLYLYTHRPSYETQMVQVRCTCKDYYFTWWLQNRHFNSSAGPDMELYTRLTPPPPEGYPYRNPISTPGACKHIIRAARYLIEKDYVTYP